MLRSHSTPLATTTTNSSSVLLSPRYDCKSPRSLYHSKHIQKKKKSPLSTTCFILCVFVFCLMVVLHRMEVIFVHRVGGTFSLLGSNRHGEEEKDINDASIPSFPTVSSEYFYWALVTADDIRVAFFNPVLKIFVGFTAFLSALVAADRVFHLYVAFYWKYLSRKGYWTSLNGRMGNACHRIRWRKYNKARKGRRRRICRRARSITQPSQTLSSNFQCLTKPRVAKISPTPRVE